MTLDTSKLTRALGELVDVVQDMLPGINEGDYEKELLQERLDRIREGLDHPL